MVFVFKRLLSEGQYDLVLQELDVFEKELDDLPRGFGVELDRLPEELSGKKRRTRWKKWEGSLK